MKKLMTIGLAAGAMAMISLAGCSGGELGTSAPVSYKDGVYEGTSQVHSGDEDGSGAGYGVVELTITGGKITACEYHTYEPDGTLKDENYGKKDGKSQIKTFITKPSVPYRHVKKYADQLAATGDINSVDAISGATISYEELKEATADALSKAQQ